MKKRSFTELPKVIQPVDDTAEAGCVLSSPPPRHESLWFSGSFLSLAPYKEKLPTKLESVTTDPSGSGNGGIWFSNQISEEEVVPCVQLCTIAQLIEQKICWTKKWCTCMPMLTEREARTNGSGRHNGQNCSHGLRRRTPPCEGKT